MPTPNWSAVRSGLLGDTGAVNASAQVNQLLGTHAISAVYQGNSILTPNGSGYFDAFQPLTLDIAQPFTMSGTTIGRVTIPVLPVGNGADLVVSLCNNTPESPARWSPGPVSRRTGLRSSRPCRAAVRPGRRPHL